MSSSDYEITIFENKIGQLNGSLKIYKAGSYRVKYIYYGVEVTNMDYSKGPYDITIIPEVCNSKFPELNMTPIEKAITGIPTSFTISCKDVYGNRISTGGEAFNVMINVSVGEEGKISSDVKTKITDYLNGNYKVEFVPPLAGEYSLTIDLRGEIYEGNKKFTILDNNCPKTTPIVCPNKLDSCVADPFECIEKPAGYDCPSVLPFSCLVNNEKKCVKSQTECDCPPDMFRCEYMNICVPNDKPYLCSYSVQIDCKNLNSLWTLGKDGICRENENDNPSQRVCPIGFLLCPDLSCRDSYSKCPNYDDCISQTMIRCPDQSCVKDQKDCPSTITCSKPNQVVCPDGTCVESELKCKSLPKCIAPNSILCPDNTCVSDIKNCPKSVSCGHGMSLCNDIICKNTCQKP